MQAVQVQQEREPLKLTDNCHECGSTNIIDDKKSGEKVCCGCGLVLNEPMIHKGLEMWRKEKFKRVGPMILPYLYDMGISTNISAVDCDGSGNPLSLSEKKRADKLRKVDRRSKYQNKNRYLSKAMPKLRRISDNLSISFSAEQKAAKIYRKAQEEGLIRGRTMEEVAAASLYVACRITEIPRTVREIAEVSRADEKTISRVVRLLIKEFNYKLPPYNIKKYIEKVANNAGISEKNVMLAHRLYEKARSRGYLQGNNPMGDATGILCYVCQHNGMEKTPNEIADAAGVTVNTVKNRYRAYEGVLGTELSD